MRDVLTLDPLDDPGGEHIIPWALGGRLERHDLVNRTTNNTLGSSLEPALLKELVFLLNALRLTSRRGKVSGYTLRPDGRDYDIASGLKPVPRKTGIFEEENEGGKGITILARDMAQARRLLEGAQEKYGKFNPGQATLVQRQEFPRSPFKLEMSLGGSLQLRAIAKMALESCAVSLGNDAICDDSFHPIREWIMDGARNHAEFAAGLRQDTAVFCNHDYRTSVWDCLPSLSSAEFQHRLFSVSGPSAGGAWGAVELFGHFRFSVLLSENPDVPEGAFAYLVDPLTGVQERPTFSTTMLASAIRAHSVQLDHFAAAFRSLLVAVQDVQKKEAISLITEEALNATLPHDDEIFTAEHAKRLGDHIAAAFMRFMLRVDREETVDVSDILGSVPTGEDPK